MLDPIHRLDFRSDRIHPVYRLAFLSIFKCCLMLAAQQSAQINMPVALVLFPPIEINVERCIDIWFDQAKTFSFHHHAHSNSVKRKCKSPTCVKLSLLASNASRGSGGTRWTIFTAEYNSWA